MSNKRRPTKVVPTAIADTVVTVAPVEGRPVILLGFSSPAFSQAIYLPAENIKDVENFAMGLFNAIVTAGEQALGLSQRTGTTVVKNDSPAN